jgi:hypothetical protein
VSKETHMRWKKWRYGAYCWVIVLLHGRIVASGKMVSKKDADRSIARWKDNPDVRVRVYSDWAHFSAARRYYDAKDRARQQ